MKQKDKNSHCSECVKENSYLKLYMLLFLVTWVIALVVFIQNFNHIQPWAQVLGVVGLLPITPFGPLMTIIVITLGKKK